jgi:hypothetical protein
MAEALCSIAGVCHVEYLRGAEADPSAAPDLLFEVPHGATLAAHFDQLRSELQGDYDEGLRDFFFVNTDVGSPELAMAVAQGVVARAPQRTAVVVRCLLPRTFVDTNRTIERDTVAAASKPGEMTPGLPPWVLHAADRDLLLDRYFAYREVVTAAFATVCEQDGRALCVHTYAPRSIDVAVDAEIAPALHRAYAPDLIETWPLRAEVDLITHDPDGVVLADDELAQRAEREFAADGVQVVRNGTYSLHPSTLAFEFAQQYVAKTLCFEVRRDLLLDAFVPFVELHPNPAAVSRMAGPLIRALVTT